MDQFDQERHVAFELLETDLDDADAIAGLVARNAIAPAREIFGLIPPEPGERIETFLARGQFSFQLGTMQPTWHADPSAALLEPFLRGAILVGRLFPGALRTADLGDWIVATPGLALIPRASALALLRWDEVTWLVGRALGAREERPVGSGSLAMNIPAPGDGLAELRRMKSLVERALLPPEDGGSDALVARAEVGLEAIDPGIADELDAILHAGARVRLVRVTDVEAALIEPVHPDAPDTYEPIVVERGVFPMTLPETISSLIALDLVETFRRGHRTGICWLCRRPFLLESQQASLARRGQPVYHPACFPERRRRYMRDYRAGRVGRRREPDGDQQVVSGDA